MEDSPEPMRKDGFQSTESSSSVPLQMMLYFNVYYSLAFGVFLGSAILNKTGTYFLGYGFEKHLPLMTWITWLLFEPMRIYFGYSGNLREGVPQLSAFLLMTLFPAIPTCVYLGAGQLFPTPIEVMCSMIMIVFLLAESLTAYRAVSRMIARQTTEFRKLCQEQQGKRGGDAAFGNKGGNHNMTVAEAEAVLRDIQLGRRKVKHTLVTETKKTN